MNKKIITAILIFLLICQLIIPKKVQAFEERTEKIQFAAEIEHQKEEPGFFDAMGAAFIQPTVTLMRFLTDVVLEFTSAFMLGEEVESVMVNYEEADKEPIPSGAEPIVIAGNDLNEYKDFFDEIYVKYPKIKYSPEELFQGKVNFLDVNFFKPLPEGSSDVLIKIRQIISQWYKVIRMLTILGLLGMLIYSGIKIIISSGQQKAKYKEMLVNWFIAVVLAFSMHYIMAFILSGIEELTRMLNTSIASKVAVNFNNKIFVTNLIGLARFQLQRHSFFAQIGSLVIYIALVVFTFKFTIEYIKRLLTMLLLTVLSPLVALMYPLDKMESNSAKGFNMWIKEYFFNALLQPFHLLLYYMFVSTALDLAANNPIYAVAVLGMMANAEKMLKKIFGFDKASGGTIKDTSQAFATGALVGIVNNGAKNPFGLFGGGSQRGGSSGGNYEEPLEEECPGYLEDEDVEDFVGEDVSSGMGSGIDINNKIYKAREGINNKKKPPADWNSFNFGDGDTSNFEDIVRRISEGEYVKKDPDFHPEEVAELDKDIAMDKNILANRISSNESDFTYNGIPLQYNDEFSNRSTMSLLDDVMDLDRIEMDPNSTPAQKRDSAAKKKKLLNVIKQRMFQNDEIKKMGENNENGAITLWHSDDKNMGKRNINLHAQKSLEEIQQLEKDILDLKNELDKLLKELEKRKREERKLARYQRRDELANEDEEKLRSRQSEIKEMYDKFSLYFMADIGDSKNRIEKLDDNSIEKVRQEKNLTKEEVERLKACKDEYNGLLGEYSAIDDELAARKIEGNIEGFEKTLSSKELKENIRKKRNQLQNLTDTRIDKEKKLREKNTEIYDRIKRKDSVILNTPQPKTATRQQRMAEGSRAAIRRLIKPVYDPEKTGEENIRKISGKLTRAVVGAGIGVTAAAVQAGISITDGNYKVAEGVATFGAGFIGAQNIGKRGKSIAQTYREAANQGDDRAQTEEYARKWRNREDVIQEYNSTYGYGKGKEMRDRAVRNYISRGITDLKEQKQAIKYANKIKEERGISEEDADRIAAATLEYKKQLVRRGRYEVIYNEEKRDKYLNDKINSYTGSQDKDYLRRTHIEFINNIKDFDQLI